MGSTFVIGIGSQRAGSTLLHKVLTDCSEVFMHPVKELHYYDTVYGVRDKKVLEEFSRKQLSFLVDEFVRDDGALCLDKKFKCKMRASHFLANRSLESFDYKELYRPCIMDNNMLGEITPEYMALPREGVKRMSLDIGRNAKIILLGRNPVDRFISSFKLLKLYGGKSYDMSGFDDDLISVFKDMPAWVAQQASLSDYCGAIERFSEFFDDVLYLSYERMIDDPLYLKEELENFLEVDVEESSLVDLFSKKVNSIGDTGKVGAKSRRAVEAEFKALIDKWEFISFS